MFFFNFKGKLEDIITNHYKDKAFVSSIIEYQQEIITRSQRQCLYTNTEPSKKANQDKETVQKPLQEQRGNPNIVQYHSYTKIRLETI